MHWLTDKFKSWQLKRHIKKFGSKNNGYFNYFSKEWFLKNQKLLLFFCNHWLLKYWFRWILRIHNDLKFTEKIDKLLPNTYRVKISENKYRSDFRTHQKFSKRIYYAFCPLWWTAHFIDWLLLDRFELLPSFQFSTLTVYPEVSSGGITCDASLTANYNTGTFSGLRAQATCNVINISGTTGIFAGIDWAGAGAGAMALYRSIYNANTSSLGAIAIISNAIVSFVRYSTAPSDLAIANYHINLSTVNPTSVNNVVAADWASSRYGSAQLSTAKTEQNWGGSGYLDFILNDLTVIAKTGVTSLSGRLVGDIINVDPGQQINYNHQYLVYLADYTGTSQDPKLVVTYSLPPSGNQMII